MTDLSDATPAEIAVFFGEVVDTEIRAKGRAIEALRARGVEWREMGDLLDVPQATLRDWYRRYQSLPPLDA